MPPTIKYPLLSKGESEGDRGMQQSDCSQLHTPQRRQLSSISLLA